MAPFGAPDAREGPKARGESRLIRNSAPILGAFMDPCRLASLRAGFFLALASGVSPRMWRIATLTGNKALSTIQLFAKTSVIDAEF